MNKRTSYNHKYILPKGDQSYFKNSQPHYISLSTFSFFSPYIKVMQIHKLQYSHSHNNEACSILYFSIQP